jgi:hypothetical protein
LSKSVSSSQLGYDSYDSYSASLLYEINVVNVDLFEAESYSEKYMTNVKVDGQPMKMEVVSVTRFSIIPEDKRGNLRFPGSPQSPPDMNPDLIPLSHLNYHLI